MSCFLDDKRIVVGKTNKKAIITVCKDCQCYYVPHFNYINDKHEVTLSLLSPTFVDSFENIELSERTDLEEFLNKFITIEDLQKNERHVKKLNKQFFKQQRKNIKFTKKIATIHKENKYYCDIDGSFIEENMTYWDLIVKLWNMYNEEKTPKNLCKPYYRNFTEYIDTSSFANMADSKECLDEGECYTKQDQERIPHFYYKLKTGEEFGILFEKAEYLQPISRKLTEQELNNLVTFLNSKSSLNELEKENKWDEGVWLWNYQNYEYNDYSPKWFPKYKKIDENVKMPDYTKLNENLENQS